MRPIFMIIAGIDDIKKAMIDNPNIDTIISAISLCLMTPRTIASMLAIATTIRLKHPYHSGISLRIFLLL